MILIILLGIAILVISAVLYIKLIKSKSGLDQVESLPQAERDNKSTELDVEKESVQFGEGVTGSEQSTPDKSLSPSKGQEARSKKYIGETEKI